MFPLGKKNHKNYIKEKPKSIYIYIYISLFDISTIINKTNQKSAKSNFYPITWCVLKYWAQAALHLLLLSFLLHLLFLLVPHLPPLTSSSININPDVNINAPSRRLSADLIRAACRLLRSVAPPCCRWLSAPITATLRLCFPADTRSLKRLHNVL